MVFASLATKKLYYNKITQYNLDIHNARTLTNINTCMEKKINNISLSFLWTSMSNDICISRNMN
jgi:hypothetical protein